MGDQLGSPDAVYFLHFCQFFCSASSPQSPVLSPQCRVLTVLLIDLRLETGDWIGAYVRGVLPREVQKVKESLEIANYKFPRDGSDPY